MLKTLWMLKCVDSPAIMLVLQGQLLLLLPLDYIEGNQISDTCETNLPSITLNIQQIVYLGDTVVL